MRVTPSGHVRNRKAARANPKPAADAISTPKPKDLFRDGLEWLISKGRLSHGQWQAARWYRSLYRDPGGPSIKSGLNFESIATAGCSHGQHGADIGGQSLDTARELKHIRAVVLGGQGDMIGAMDEVCGKGATPIEAAGKDRAAGKLEAVLLVALDLIVCYMTAKT